MRNVIKNCFAIAAIGALLIWSLHPFALMSFGLYAAGLGFTALCMHLTEDPSVSPPPSATVYVTTEPTFGRPWSWNPFSWVLNSRVSHHQDHHNHNHQHTTHPSYFEQRRGNERVVHVPIHHDTLFTRAQEITVPVDNRCNRNEHHQRHVH